MLHFVLRIFDARLSETNNFNGGGYSMKWVSIFLGALCLPAVVSAQTQSERFDLNCVGKTYESGEGGLANKANHFPKTVRYRIDFVEGRWCRDECKETEAIVALDNQSIILEQSAEGETSYDKVVVLNRETGQLLDRFRVFWPKEARLMIMTTANCVKEPFSGFPSYKF